MKAKKTANRICYMIMIYSQVTLMWLVRRRMFADRTNAALFSEQGVIVFHGKTKFPLQSITQQTSSVFLLPFFPVCTQLFAVFSSEHRHVPARSYPLLFLIGVHYFQLLRISFRESDWKSAQPNEV